MKIIRAEPLHQSIFGNEKMGIIDSLFFKREQQKTDFNRRMFDEDFARLFPPTNRRNGNLFEIVSNDDQLNQKLLGNVKTRYPHHLVDNTVRELVGEIAQSQIWYGRAFYFIQDDREQEEVHVVSLRVAGVVRLFGTHFQWVPKRTERHWVQDEEELPREIRILDASKLMCFDIPTSIKRMLTAQNKTLAALDKHRLKVNNFHLPATHENPNPASHFDFRVWNDKQERAFYRATRITGWTGRKYNQPKRSEFFDCFRLIRFRRNQLLLRDSILNQLSRELTRIGRGYKTDFSVNITGSDELPSIEHLNKLEALLESEEVGFTEIMNYCYDR